MMCVSSSCIAVQATLQAVCFFMLGFCSFPELMQELRAASGQWYGTRADSWLECWVASGVLAWLRAEHACQRFSPSLHGLRARLDLPAEQAGVAYWLQAWRDMHQDVLPPPIADWLKVRSCAVLRRPDLLC